MDVHPCCENLCRLTSHNGAFFNIINLASLSGVLVDRAIDFFFFFYYHASFNKNIFVVSIAPPPPPR